MANSRRSKEETMSAQTSTVQEPNTSLPGIRQIRQLYNWVLSYAESPHGLLALFILAFVESSFFPIPPDVLLIALALGKPRKAFIFAAVCSVGSVLGGVFGWFIGYALYETIGRPIVEFYHFQAQFEQVRQLYQGNAFVAIAIAGFTPIPYKVFTIAAGVFDVSLNTLILASALSRTGRFVLVAGLIFFLGERVRHFIEKYFDLLTVVFTILLIGGFFLIRYMK